MNLTLDPALLTQISSKLEKFTGLYFPRTKWSLLERSLRALSKEKEFSSLEECADWFLNEKDAAPFFRLVSKHFTINETYFFRDPAYFDMLKEKVIPELAAAKSIYERNLRIWSAGCSSGEEPYSLAMLLDLMRKELQGFNTTVLATDIDTGELLKASLGSYRDWSFRNDYQGYRKRYFIKHQHGQHELDEKIREKVNFEYLNLIEDNYPAMHNQTTAVDIIFCRNVLMYFSGETAGKVISKFHRCLNDGGWLFVSPVEIKPVIFDLFETVRYRDRILFRKGKPGSVREIEKTAAPKFDFEEMKRVWIAEKAKGAGNLTGTVRPEGSRSSIPPKPEVEIEKKREAVQEGVEETCRKLANEGKLNEARSLLEEALAQDKLNSNLQYLKAVILLEEGAVEEAKRTLIKTLYIDPDMVIAHFSMANMALGEGKKQMAIKHFENCRSLLKQLPVEGEVPESEGMLNGRMLSIVESALDFHRKGRK